MVSHLKKNDNENDDENVKERKNPGYHLGSTMYCQSVPIPLK